MSGRSPGVGWLGEVLLQSGRERGREHTMCEPTAHPVMHVHHGAAGDLVRVGEGGVPADGVLRGAGDAESLCKPGAGGRLSACGLLGTWTTRRRCAHNPVTP